MSDIVQVLPGVWNLTPEGGSAAFLIIGEKRALLIDTSWGRVKLRPLIAELTDKPVTLVNTHGHTDHVGSNREFDEFYMHPLDIPIMCWKNDNARPVNEGDEFDLGGRTLEVFHIPGHSPGDIALLDRKNRIIFAGDMLADQPIYFIPGESSTESFISSMDKLAALSDCFDTVVCTHGQTLMDKSIIARYREAAVRYKNGELRCERQTRGSKVRSHEVEIYTDGTGIGFVYPLNWTGMDRVPD